MVAMIVIVGLATIVAFVWFTAGRKRVALTWEQLEERHGVHCPREIPPGQHYIVTDDQDAGSILSGSPNIHDTMVANLEEAVGFLHARCDDVDFAGYVFDDAHRLVAFREWNGRTHLRPRWLKTTSLSD